MKETYHQTRVHTDSDGNVLGAPLFLGKADLNVLEWDAAVQDVIHYSVKGNEIRLSKPDSSN